MYITPPGASVPKMTASEAVVTRLGVMSIVRDWSSPVNVSTFTLLPPMSLKSFRIPDENVVTSPMAIIRYEPKFPLKVSVRRYVLPANNFPDKYPLLKESALRS